MVEDSEYDAVLLEGELRKGGYSPIVSRVETAETLEEALGRQEWDIIFADFTMPQFSSVAALEIVKQRGLDVPFIIVSGTISEDQAVAAMKAGSHDYILKGNLKRLIPVVQRELREVEERRNRRRAEEERESAFQRVRELAFHLKTAEEAERKRIARELHDEFGQMLTALKLDLNWLSGHLGALPAEVRGKVSSMTALIDDLSQSMRRLTTLLRPSVLTDLGLAEALEWQARNFETKTGIRCRVVIGQDVSALDIDDFKATAIFRIVQELLTNVARHARATCVSVDLRSEASTLLLAVEDNGRGITDAEIGKKRAFGLLGIRERVALFGGEFSIRGQAGKGTSVMVRIPR
jgi:signal transduction histidine kinase